MSYRIVIETEVSGKKWYYVQKSYLLLFWFYLRQIMDMSMYAYRISFETLEDAEQQIQKEVNRQYKRSQKKVSKREIYPRQFN